MIAPARPPSSFIDASVATGCAEDLRAELRVIARLILGRTAELHGRAVAPELAALSAFASGSDPAAPGRFTRLAHRLELTPTESLLVAAALSPGADPRFGAAWRLLGGDEDASQPSLAVLGAVLDDRDEVARVLAPSHVLRALRLVQCVDPGSTSPYDYVLAPTVPLVGWLSAATWDESGLGVEHRRSEALLGDVVVAGDDAFRLVAGLRSRWERPRRRRPETPLAVCIEGMPGSGREHLAEAIAGALGLDVGRAPLDEAHAERVPALLRGALLASACPVLIVHEDTARHLPAALAPIAAHYDGPLIVVCETRPPFPPPWNVLEIPMRLPNVTVRERLWKRALGGGNAAIGARVARLPLGHGAVFRAAANASAAAGITGATLDEDRLVDAARAELATRSPLSERIHGKRRLDDLVAPDDLKEQLVELIAFARHRRAACEAWGLDRLGGDIGVKALFYGPPGTGKTMAAQIVATEIDIDLYRVDLASVVSKWVGETEKNLRQVFQQAEMTGGMLLFDEADALFSKRVTNVQSSMDRHSNLEVNYLLQRMESFAGVCVLTTNHDRVLDEAFRRRLNFRVRFPAPDERERELLWRKLLETVPREAELDLVTVARRFDMAGGNIRNAVIRSVVLAIDEGAKVATRHLLEGAMREFAEIGRVMRVVGGE